MNRNVNPANINVDVVKKKILDGQKALNKEVYRQERSFYCHYFNNYKDCPWGDQCRYEHSYTNNCKDDGECRTRLCPFQHQYEAQSFLGLSHVTRKPPGGSVRSWNPRDRDMRPQSWRMERGMSPYEVRQRQRGW